MNQDNIVQKIWNLCNVLRGDGISYHEYISELTYILFLKIAEETKTENHLPINYRWKDLLNYKGENLLGFYQEMLTHLGVHAESQAVRKIYAFPTTVFSHSENLKVVIDGVSRIDWHSVSRDGIGQIYEGLLAKNSEDARSGAGQYFTPRALVDCIVQLTRPKIGEVIQDPACGTGGFLISADHYIRQHFTASAYNAERPTYQGVEIERSTYRLCFMNTFLHSMDANIILGDALTNDALVLDAADLILANPPFGAKGGSARENRSDLSFPRSNKQFAFLQHIYQNLKPGGRAAVVLPDNVLFEGNVGRKIRNELMELCDLHTILRLPSGIFYAQGVKTNVLFFRRGYKNKEQTKNTWIYDMRTNLPQFGKRTPLTSEYFEDFIKCFGSDPFGKSNRIDQGNSGRFRTFSREEILEKNDNLDITWLRDEINKDGMSDPDQLAAIAISDLETAISYLNSVLEVLGSEDN